MAEINLDRPLKLSDLEMDKIFAEDELIVDRKGSTMDTVRWEGGIESGQEYDIMNYKYDIVATENGEVTSINCNGHSEITTHNPLALAYSRKLNSAGLYPRE